MRTMYDALNADLIPPLAPGDLVAGYIDAGPHPATPPWTDADFARFAGHPHVRIATQAHTNAGDVLDVEDGDATPDQAPSWVAMRRHAGHPGPAVYCSQSAWSTVADAFDAQHIAQPTWWIAWYPGPGAVLVDGAHAHQWGSDPANTYDISAVADHWPGIDPNPTAPTTEDDMLAMTTGLDGTIYLAAVGTDSHIYASSLDPKTRKWGGFGQVGDNSVLVRR